MEGKVSSGDKADERKVPPCRMRTCGSNRPRELEAYKRRGRVGVALTPAAGSPLNVIECKWRCVRPTWPRQEVQTTRRCRHRSRRCERERALVVVAGIDPALTPHHTTPWHTTPGLENFTTANRSAASYTYLNRSVLVHAPLKISWTVVECHPQHSDWDPKLSGTHLIFGWAPPPPNEVMALGCWWRWILSGGFGDYFVVFWFWWCGETGAVGGI